MRRMDLSDWLVLAGLLVMGAGLGMVSIALALAVVGAVMLLSGIMLSIWQASAVSDDDQEAGE